MREDRDYQVVLLPHGDVAAYGYSLYEADAWIRTYNEVMQGSRQRAVIAHQPSPAATAGRSAKVIRGVKNS